MIYRALQFRGAKKPGRTTPETKFRDDYEVLPKKREQSDGRWKEIGRLKSGYERRRAKLEYEKTLNK